MADLSKLTVTLLFYIHLEKKEEGGEKKGIL